MSHSCFEFCVTGSLALARLNAQYYMMTMENREALVIFLCHRKTQQTSVRSGCGFLVSRLIPKLPRVILGMKAFNGTKWNGTVFKIQRAKPDYLTRFVFFRAVLRSIAV